MQFQIICIFVSKATVCINTPQMVAEVCFAEMTKEG